MVVRAEFPAKDQAEAEFLSRSLRDLLRPREPCNVILLEPHHRFTGHFKVYVKLVETRGDDPVSFLRQMASELAIGSWDVGHLDPDESWAVWDVKFGGHSAVPRITWYSLELLPPTIQPDLRTSQ